MNTQKSLANQELQSAETRMRKWDYSQIHQELNGSKTLLQTTGNIFTHLRTFYYPPELWVELCPRKIHMLKSP